jgi:uncharacterized protein (TIGR03067 family)
MRVALVLTVLAVAAPVRPDRFSRPEEPKRPQDQIVGDWQLVKLARGLALGEQAVNDNRVLRITPTDTVFMMNGQPSVGDGLTANYTIDWSKSPAVITFMPKQRGGKMLGIFKIEGDTLVVALNTGGGQPPADFASAAMIGHYKRVGK